MFDDDLFHDFRPPIKFISVDGYGKGFWNGEAISKLQTSHLNNIVDMLIRRGRSNDEMIQANRERKIAEIREEIKKRLEAGEEILHSKHSFTITEAMILEIAQKHGVNIPKTGAGVYFVFKDKSTFRMKEGQIQVKYDTQKILNKGKKNVKTRISKSSRKAHAK